MMWVIEVRPGLGPQYFGFRTTSHDWLWTHEESLKGPEPIMAVSAYVDTCAVGTASHRCLGTIHTKSAGSSAGGALNVVTTGCASGVSTLVRSVTYGAA